MCNCADGLRIFQVRHKLFVHVDLPQRLRIAPGGVFVSGMGFPAQGKEGQEAATEHGAGIFVGVCLLAFVDDHGTDLFAVEGEGAPSAIGPAEYADNATLFVLLAAVALKTLHETV